MLGVCYWAFSLAVGSGGSPPAVVHGLLMAVTSLVKEHGLSGMWASAAAAPGLSACGSWALEYRLSSLGTRA